MFTAPREQLTVRQEVIPSQVGEEFDSIVTLSNVSLKSYDIMGSGIPADSAATLSVDLHLPINDWMFKRLTSPKDAIEHKLPACEYYQHFYNWVRVTNHESQPPRAGLAGLSLRTLKSREARLARPGIVKAS